MWKHPFAMRTTFRTCILANFAFPPSALRPLIPAALELDLHDHAAYVSVVIADMEKMRPVGVPRALGVTYSQVVYRAVVRHQGARGVFFLRSDANHRLMCRLGNWLTFFRFHHARGGWSRDGSLLAFDFEPHARGDDAAIHGRYDLAGASLELRSSSAFDTLAEATAFLVELFDAYACPHGSTTRVRVDRGPWCVRVVDDARCEYPYMQALGGRLDSVFVVDNVPYRWHRLERVAPLRLAG